MEASPMGISAASDYGPPHPEDRAAAASNFGPLHPENSALRRPHSDDYGPPHPEEYASLQEDRAAAGKVVIADEDLKVEAGIKRVIAGYSGL
jgi:hypothetical protein